MSPLLFGSMHKFVKRLDLARHYNVSLATIDAWTLSGKLTIAFLTPSGRKRYLNPEWKEEEAKA